MIAMEASHLGRCWLIMTNIKMLWDYISKHYNFYFCKNASSAKCNQHWMYFVIIFHECTWIGETCEYNKGALLSLKIRILTVGQTSWHFQKVLSFLEKNIILFINLLTSHWEYCRYLFWVNKTDQIPFSHKASTFAKCKHGCYYQKKGRSKKMLKSK